MHCNHYNVVLYAVGWLRNLLESIFLENNNLLETYLITNMYLYMCNKIIRKYKVSILVLLKAFNPLGWTTHKT